MIGFKAKSKPDPMANPNFSEVRMPSLENDTLLYTHTHTHFLIDQIGKVVLLIQFLK